MDFAPHAKSDASAPPSIHISTLDFSSATRDPDLFLSILALSNQVFGLDPTQNKTPHSDPSVWKSKLSDPRSLIIYATEQVRRDHDHNTTADIVNITTSNGSANIPTTIPTSPKIIGLFFTYPKTQPEITIPGLHIWLAAIHPSARGKGVFAQLLEETKRHAVRCMLELVTVVTVPRRFGRMYEILTRDGGGWEFVAWRSDGHGDGHGHDDGGQDQVQIDGDVRGDKVLMKLRL